MKNKFLTLLIVVPFFAQGVEISANHKLFFDNSLNDLKKYILETKKTNFIGDTYSPKVIYSDYANNELAANKKYSPQFLRIKATVEKIKEDFLGDGFIESKIDKSTFGNANFKVNNEDSRVLALKRGDKVDLMCKFSSFTLENLYFDECLFTDQYLDERIKLIKENFANFGTVGYSPVSYAEFMINLIYSKAGTERINKLCENPKKCSMDFLDKKALDLNPTEKELEEIKKIKARF